MPAFPLSSTGMVWPPWHCTALLDESINKEHLLLNSSWSSRYPKPSVSAALTHWRTSWTTSLCLLALPCSASVSSSNRAIWTILGKLQGGQAATGAPEDLTPLHTSPPRSPVLGKYHFCFTSPLWVKIPTRKFDMLICNWEEKASGFTSALIQFHAFLSPRMSQMRGLAWKYSLSNSPNCHLAPR